MDAHLLDAAVGRGTNVSQVLQLIVRQEVGGEIGMWEGWAAWIKWAGQVEQGLFIVVVMQEVDTRESVHSCVPYQKPVLSQKWYNGGKPCTSPSTATA